MNLALDGKVVIITGASRGIGLACAQAFVDENATVVLVSRNAPALAEACRTISPDGSRASFVAADLSQAGTEASVVEEVLSRHPAIDVLVNCAGDAQGGSFWELTDADWSRNLELKLFATIRMTRAVGKVMRRQRSGRIITVVGSAGRQPEAHLLPVSVANAGLLALTRGLADDLGPQGVTVLAVNPGAVRTERFLARLKARAGDDPQEIEKLRTSIAERTPLRRVGEPADVAAWITFMASERAAHATGVSVTVDGGLSRVPG